MKFFDRLLGMEYIEKDEEVNEFRVEKESVSMVNDSENENINENVDESIEIKQIQRKGLKCDFRPFLRKHYNIMKVL